MNILYAKPVCEEVHSFNWKALSYKKRCLFLKFGCSLVLLLVLCDEKKKKKEIKHGNNKFGLIWTNDPAASCLLPCDLQVHQFNLDSCYNSALLLLLMYNSLNTLLQYYSFLLLSWFDTMQLVVTGFFYNSEVLKMKCK